MYCPRCGIQLQDNSAFCNQCGLQIAPIPMPLQIQAPPLLSRKQFYASSPELHKCNQKRAAWAVCGIVFASIGLIGFFLSPFCLIFTILGISFSFISLHYGAKLNKQYDEYIRKHQNQGPFPDAPKWQPFR